jgi:hypothetical protein
MNREALRFPVVPEDLYRNGTATRSVARACAAVFLSELRGRSAEAIVKQSWPDDEAAAFITKAAVSPTSTTNTSALTPTIAAGFLRAVAPASAAVRLFERSLQLNFAGVYRYSFAYPTAAPMPIFIGEGAPFPIVTAAMATAFCGPMHKIMLGSTLTNEVANGSTDTAANIIGNILADQTSKSLDYYVFDNVAESAIRPPGLLNGVTPITADTNGAIAKDLAAIANAITVAGGNYENIVFVAGAAAATKLRYLAGPGFASAMFGSGSVAADTVIGIDVSSIATGSDGVPSIEMSKETVVHMEDTTPLPIATGAQGSGVVATPTRSLFQTDSMALRVRMNCAWSVLRAGAVQVINTVKW